MGFFITSWPTTARDGPLLLDTTVDLVEWFVSADISTPPHLTRLESNSRWDIQGDETIPLLQSLRHLTLEALVLQGISWGNPVLINKISRIVEDLL